MTHTLQVDIHEPAKHITALRDDMPALGFDVVVAKYEVADYFVGNRLGVERKAPGDFADSVKSGRLFQQAHELAQNFEYACVIVDGDVSDIPLAHPLSVIASLYIRSGVPTFTVGDGELVPYLTALCKRLVTESSVVYTPIRKSATKGEHQLNIIASLPGVGVERARRVLDSFGSPEKALRCIDEWRVVDGIGDKIVERVKEVMGSG